MSTTVDLPDVLATEVERLAAQEGRTVNDVVADLVRAGMAPAPKATNGQIVAKNLPLIKVRPAPPENAQALTQQEWCDWIKEKELQLEVEHYEKALGHQHVDRVDSGDSPPARTGS